MSGTHEARTPGEILPILDELTKLHENGMVHGDIRVYNMVFSPADDGGKPHGYLIDFDFGGVEGKVKYPSGYLQDLRDGTRRGEAGQLITKENDWIDLANVIFKQLAINMPEGKSPGDLAIMFVKQTNLRNKFGSRQHELPGDAKELRKCLEEMYQEGWKLEPSGELREALDKEISRATGSPTKVKASKPPAAKLAGLKRTQSDT
jgi:serine/threonine protein kinase